MYVNLFCGRQLLSNQLLPIAYCLTYAYCLFYQNVAYCLLPVACFIKMLPIASLLLPVMQLLTNQLRVS